MQRCIQNSANLRWSVLQKTFTAKSRSNFRKRSILDVWQDSEYVSGMQVIKHFFFSKPANSVAF